MKKVFALIFVLILSAGFIISCKKDKGNPPVLPPPESMIIDFSNFTTAKKSLEVLPGQKGTENSNWEFRCNSCRGLETDHKYDPGSSCNCI